MARTTEAIPYPTTELIAWHKQNKIPLIGMKKGEQ